MPFVDLPHEDVRMFYRTNLPGGGPGGAITPANPLLADRETILLLPGTMIDSTDMSEIFASPLSKLYNLVTLEVRSTGQTTNGVSLVRDSWTDTVDVVKAMETLGIESAHVFAVSGISVLVAKRIAILWPERARSLILIAVAPPDPPEWIMESWSELMQSFLTAKDIETMEEMINEFYPLAYGEYLSEAKIDEVALYWETQYYPANGLRFYDWAIPFMLRQRLGHEYLSLIRQPALIVNGGAALVSSPEEAQLLQEGLTDAAGGAKLVIMPDAPDQLHYIPQFAAVLVDETLNFLSNLPSWSHRPKMNREQDPWKRALLELAELRKDEAMKERDPKFAASFSGVTLDMQAMRKAAFEKIKEDEKNAFCPIGPNGEPPRKFSERKMAEIAYGAAQSRSRSDSGLWVNGVELEESEVVESDDEEPASLSTKLQKALNLE